MRRNFPEYIHHMHFLINYIYSLNFKFTTGPVQTLSHKNKSLLSMPADVSNVNICIYTVTIFFYQHVLCLEFFSSNKSMTNIPLEEFQHITYCSAHFTARKFRNLQRMSPHHQLKDWFIQVIFYLSFLRLQVNNYSPDLILRSGYKVKICIIG